MYKIEMEREKGDYNQCCRLLLNNEEFNWHIGNQEDKDIFIEMLTDWFLFWKKCDTK